MQYTNHQHTALRRFSWLATCLALGSSLLAGCSLSTPAGPQLDKNQTLTFPLVPFFVGDRPYVVPSLVLDAGFLNDLYSTQVMTMIQVQLVTYDQNLNVIGDAAKSWSTSDNGKTWTFHLRDNLKWSDGTPMTSSDFAAGIVHALDPNACTATTIYNSASSSGSCNADAPFLMKIMGASEFLNSKVTTLPQTLSGIATPDPQTLIFTLTDPTAYFPEQMATAASVPLERSLYAQYGYQFFEHFVEGKGQSGPFMISTWGDPANPNVKDAEHSTVLHFVRNPNWWGKPLTLTGVTMPLYADQETQYKDYTSNQLDFSTVPSHEYPFARDLSDFHQVLALAIDYFGMNWLVPPFNNQKVRQAFDLALNKQLLVDSVFQGARIPTNHIIPEGIQGHNAKLLNPPDTSGSPALTGNQALAKQFIQQVAQGCVEKYDTALCPYIVGTPPLTTPVSKVSTGGANCPAFNIGATPGDTPGTFQTTQKPIIVYTPTGNPDRVHMTDASAQVWSNVLCLNVVFKADNSFENPIYTSLGKPTKYSIWTIGWAADYPDPQDFTTLQFDPLSSNNTVNLGYSAPGALGSNADIVQLMHNADKENDPQKRIQAYEQIEQQLVDLVAWIPYDQPKFLYRVRAQVQGLVVPANEVIPDQVWPNIFIEAR